MASVDDSKKWMSWRFPRRQGDDNPDGRKEPENDDDDNDDLGDLSNQKNYENTIKNQEVKRERN
jgi:hypothetical protein